MLGALALLVLGGMAYSILSWSRRRNAVRAAAATAGFSVVEDPKTLITTGVTAFREFRAAVPGKPGAGRFENVLRRNVRRRRGDATMLVFDYAAGSSAGDALLPQGTYVCFLTPGQAWPTVRITPRPAPRPTAARKLPGQAQPRLEAVDLGGSEPAEAAFAALYEVEGESPEAVREFLSRGKIELFRQASPPWLVEVGPEGMVLARRPGSGALRRFHRLPPEDLPTFAEAAERAYEVLAETGARS